MSASRIPNLNTLRRGSAQPRGRTANNAITTERSKDALIINTDHDAATSRLSAVEAGYLIDPYAALLTPDATHRRLPLMNRGTYIRTQGIDQIVQAFLSSQQGRKQIISLGAGSDTRFFRLRQAHRNIDLVYHEIDFESNVRSKIERITACSDDIERLSGIKISTVEGKISGPDFFIHSQDLRMLKLDESLPGLEDIPTLLISECCLIYLSPDEAQQVLTYFTSSIGAPIAIAIYEPIRPHDAFGRTMVQNLVARGIHLRTLESYAELDLQRQRLEAHGFTSRSADTEFIWRKWISENEKERIDSLEWLDEIEEFILLAKHYCICWGWRGFASGNMLQELEAE